MARKATLQMTFTKGELDPDLSDRVDLEHFYDSLARAPNSIFHPQGGFSDRGGFELVSDLDVLEAGSARRLRNRIVPVHVTADNLTANNGGTSTYLADQDLETVYTTNAVTSSTFVVCEIDLGVAQYVDFIDLVGFYSELGPADNVMAVQYYTGTAWAAFADPLDAAPAKHIRTTPRTRRFGTAPGGPGGIRVAARNWRVVALDAVGIGTISVQNLRLWRETAALSPIDVVEVSRTSGTTYELVVTDRNIDVFDRQRYVASIPVPVAGQQIDEMSYTGGFDTLLLFHEQIETPRIVRQGSAGEWDIGATPYENVPDLREQITFTGDQDEIQEITLTGLEAGDVVFLCLGDRVSVPITYSTAAALPADVLPALDALPGVSSVPALEATAAETAPGTVVLTVRFTEANGLQAWPLLTAMTEAAGVTALTRVVQAGLDSGGKLFGRTTGWPRCGAFVQQRLVIGGFRAAPTSGMAGRPSSWDFLDTSDPMTADLAVLFTLNTDAVETISSIFLGRHLQIFTEAGEWYAVGSTIDATQPMGFTRATSHGVRRAVPLAFADGATLFVQAGGRTLRDLLWRDAEQSYGAEPLSVLAPQILSDVIDVAHRSARSVTEGNLIFMVNTDGTAGCLTLLRGQNVIAGSPWSTDGAFKAMMCDVRHDLYAVTERAGAHWLERWTPAMPLDFATTVAGDGITSIAGAHHLEGRADVWAVADGEVLGPFQVVAGAFALGVAADSVTYGLLPAWSVQTQELRGKLSAELPFRPPARVYEVELSVKDTGHITLGNNGAAHAEVPLVRMGDAFDDGGPLQSLTGGAPGLPLFERLYTGKVRVGGLAGFSRRPYLELGRTVPSPVTVKSLRLEIIQKDG